MMDMPDPRQSVADLWGDAVTGGETGFTPVPDILMRSQAKLGLSPIEVVVLLNILMHWWEAHDWPYPRVSSISRRMGTSQRTVQRTVRSLEDKGFLVHRSAESIGRGPSVRRFDLSGLVFRLQDLAEERREGSHMREGGRIAEVA